MHYYTIYLPASGLERANSVLSILMSCRERKMHRDRGREREREQAYCSIIASILNHSSSHYIETNTMGSGAINRLRDVSLLAPGRCILMTLKAISSCASFAAQCVFRIRKKKKHESNLLLISCSLWACQRSGTHSSCTSSAAGCTQHACRLLERQRPCFQKIAICRIGRREIRTYLAHLLWRKFISQLSHGFYLRLVI